MQSYEIICMCIVSKCIIYYFLREKSLCKAYIYHFLHLYLPRQVLHRAAYLFGFHCETVHEVKYLLYVYRRLVGRCFDDVWLIVEVTVLFAIYKRYAARCVLTVLQRLYHGYPATVASERADSKLTLVKDRRQFVAKHRAMKHNMVSDVILVDDGLQPRVPLARFISLVWMHSSNDMEHHIALSAVLVVLAQTS